MQFSIRSLISGLDSGLKHIREDTERAERLKRFKFTSSQSGAQPNEANEDRSHTSPFHQLLYNNHRIEPFFDTTLTTNVTVSEGSAAAYLPCRVHQLGDRTVCHFPCFSKLL